MDLALGALGWAPSEFWEATPRELCAAVIGRQRAMGQRADTAERMGDDGIALAPGCTREGTLRVLEEMRTAKES
jgi:hypothetical protein